MFDVILSLVILGHISLIHCRPEECAKVPQSFILMSFWWTHQMCSLLCFWYIFYMLGTYLFCRAMPWEGSSDCHPGGVQCQRLCDGSHGDVSKASGCWSDLCSAFPVVSSRSQSQRSSSTFQFQGWNLNWGLGGIDSWRIGLGLCSSSWGGGASGLGRLPWTWRHQRGVGAQCLVSLGKSRPGQEVWAHTEARGAASWTARDGKDNCGPVAGEPPEGKILSRPRNDAAGSCLLFESVWIFLAWHPKTSRHPTLRMLHSL